MSYIAGLVDAGVLVESECRDYVSPITLPPKGDSFRFCLDLTILNSMLIRDHYPLSDPTQLYGKLLGCNFLASFDFTSGYLQAPFVAKVM